MRKIALVSTAFAALMMGAASAADMAARYTKAPVAVAPAYGWTGFYIGVNGGYGWSQDNNNTLSGADTGAGGILSPFGVPQTFAGIGLAMKSSGALVGGTVGYNWQQGNYVFGVEADGDWANIKGSSTAIAGGGVGFLPAFQRVTVTGTKNLDGLETIRGRIGFLAAPQFLLYATGGLAVGQEKVAIQALGPTFAPPLAAFNSSTRSKGGYTVGAGAEWKFAPQWSVKAEYLYVDLGNQSSTIAYAYPGATSTATLETKHDYNIARVGLNYQFSKAVVAKY